MIERKTITVRHEQARDRYGDLIAGVAIPDDTIRGCMVAPRSTSEDPNLTVYTGLVVHAPPGSTVLASDRLVIPGESGEWQVEGDPADWVGRGVDIPVRRVT